MNKEDRERELCRKLYAEGWTIRELTEAVAERDAMIASLTKHLEELIVAGEELIGDFADAAKDLREEDDE